MGLKEYRRKRDFQRTPEPQGDHNTSAGNSFVVQKHAASRLHYDFRLELDGVLKSWAVPKGPSYDPSVKALAVHVEDHPIEYGSFEGIIPKGEYGGGTVMLWDRGTWEPEGDPARDYRKGKLTFRLDGEKLHGRWALIRMGGRGKDSDRNWLLKKVDDEEAKQAEDIDIDQLDRSVATGRSMDEIANDADRVWSSNGEVAPSAPKKADTRDIPKLREFSGARKRPMNKTYKPQLATLVRQPPDGDQWLHELKFDGYRLICRLHEGDVQLMTRGQQNWTDRFSTIVAELSGLRHEAVIDGEVVVLRRDGTTDFQALQNHINRGRDDDVVLYAFDLLYLDGVDLRQVPLLERKQVLQSLLAPFSQTGAVRFSDHIQGHGAEFYSQSCRHAVEGIVSKRADAIYEERRTKTWLKVKCLNRQEFVIGGWTDPSGSRSAFGALLLGYFDDSEKLQYCGRVGTGFNQESLQLLKERMGPLEAKKPPFDRPPKGSEAKGVHWVRPELVAEVEFAQWTEDGMLRHPSFQGLREDKKAKEVKRERPATSAQTSGGSSKSKSSSNATCNKPPLAGVRLSNPGRVLYPDLGVTKRDLAEYFEAVAEVMLPHIVDRPLTLVRCPQGRQRKCFYQKHANESMPEPVTSITVPEKSGTVQYVAVNDVAGLITLAQLGVLEIHPWGSRADKLDRPDRLIFDLDPGDGVPWSDLIESAIDLRARLEDLGLQVFIRTTGGKGLHLVAPLTRRSDWEDVKGFARAIANKLTQRFPKRYIATSSKAKRKGLIYVDYLRNDSGATAIASYSTRARPGATVATPLHWDELSPSLQPQDFNTRTVPEQLSKLRHDPWEEMFRVQQSINKSMWAGIEEW